MNITNTDVVNMLDMFVDADKQKYYEDGDKEKAFITKEGVKYAFKEINPLLAGAIADAIQIKSETDPIEVEQSTAKLAELAGLIATALVAVTGNFKVIQVTENLIQNIDDTGTYTYIGMATPQSTGVQAVWQIKRIDASGNIRFAGGVATFTQVWDNRISLSYS